jgi:hypothetical protein
MKPGQYRGADGDVKKWQKDERSDVLWHLGQDTMAVMLRVADARAAAAALVALADELETEYVELPSGARLTLLRGEVESIEFLDPQSAPVPGEIYIAEAFTAGCERASTSEVAALRKHVEDLKKTIGLKTEQFAAETLRASELYEKVAAYESNLDAQVNRWMVGGPWLAAKETKAE